MSIEGPTRPSIPPEGQTPKPSLVTYFGRGKERVRTIEVEP